MFIKPRDNHVSNLRRHAYAISLTKVVSADGCTSQAMVRSVIIILIRLHKRLSLTEFYRWALPCLHSLFKPRASGEVDLLHADHVAHKESEGFGIYHGRVMDVITREPPSRVTVDLVNIDSPAGGGVKSPTRRTLHGIPVFVPVCRSQICGWKEFAGWVIGDDLHGVFLLVGEGTPYSRV